MLTSVYVRKIVAALFSQLGLFTGMGGRKGRLPIRRIPRFLPRLEVLEGRLAPAGVITTVPGTPGLLIHPSGVAVDSQGDLFIADTNDNVIREISATGVITTVAGNGNPGYTGDNGLATNATLTAPIGVAVDNQGNLFIADTTNSVIREVIAATGVITTVAGAGGVLARPQEIALDGQGNLFIADKNNNEIRELNLTTGVITTVAGNGNPGYTGDNGLATNATLNGPIGVAVDNQGNLFIADTTNSVIREVAAATGVITTVAGAGGVLARPQGIALDGQGNLFIADKNNNEIRELNLTTGVITTVAGNGNAGYTGDNGPATSAELNQPTAVAMDGQGDIFIADTNNNVIREVAAPATTPTVQFSAGSETVNQGAGTFSITVTLSAASSQAVSAPFTLGGSAVGGTDYSGLTASPLVIAAGQTTGTITGTLLADVGASQTLSFTLGSPGNATLGSTTVNTLTITEPTPSVQFSAASETVNQSVGTFSITVSLSAASDQAVSAPFTLGGGAVGGADYSGVTASPLVIAAGHTAGTITGSLLPDVGASQTLSFTLGSPSNATLGSTTVNTLTITEPQPTVQFSASSETVNQSAGTFDITVTLSAASDQAVSAPFTLGGSAVGGADYSGVTASPLVIAAGHTAGTITGSLLPDVGASQTLSFTLGSPSNATLGSTTVNTLTITEPQPTVQFSASSETVNQSAGTFDITVTLSAASDQAVSAPFTLGGSAVGGADYSGVTASPLVISAGQTTGTITGTLLADVGASQTLSFTLGSPSNATLGSTTVNTLTITEPQPSVQFSASSETVNQSAGMFSITVSLSTASDQAVSAPFTLGGSAVGGTDYSGVTASPLVIAAGHTTGAITGSLLADVGASQTLSFTLGSPSNATLGSTTVNTLTITEPQPTVQFSASSETVNQSAGTFSITVSLSAASDQAVSAPFTLGGSAIGGTDYSGVTASPLVIGAGQTSGTITGTLLADVGASQTLSFTLGSPSNATLGSTTVNTLTIIEPQPTVQFSTASETVNQSAGTFSITVTLSAASDQAVSVPFTLGGSAVGGTDYSGVTASPLAIAAGQTTGTITGTLPADVGASQTLSFTLGSPSNATLGSTTVNTLTITEPQPSVQFSTASETVNQSAGTFSITVTLSAASDQAVSAPFTLGGSAVGGTDYSGVTASPLAIAVGQTTGTITGTLLADVGASQTLSFTLGSPSNATLGSTTVNTLTITEPQPSVQFSTASETVNQSAGTFSITVSLSAASDQAVSAPFTLGGSAVGGADYSGVTASPLVIAAGHTTGTITGTLLADVGASQTLSFTLGSPSNATLGSTTVNTLTITEPQPSVQFSTASETVNQSAGTFSITVSLSAASDQAVSAPFTLGGSAVGGADYSGVTASPLVIAAGHTTGTITGTLIPDIGASQTLSFTLGSPGNATLGSTTVNTLTITEPQPTVQFSTASETVNQSAGTFSITVSLSAASDQAVSAPFTLGGSAVGGTDYSGVTASPLVIGAGQTSGTITGTLLVDVGASQTLTLTLGTPSNATLGSTTVNTLTITEPQPSVQFSASSETVNQSAGTFSITLTLSAASDQAVSVPFALGGIAIGGTDYSGVTASPLVIAAGHTAGTITGTLLADVGASQTLSFTLGTPSNATLGSTTVNTLTITEPTPSVQFGAASETVNQSAGMFSITVSLSTASDQAVSAPFTLGGSAVGGTDYSGVTASPLVIAAGHTTGAITGTLLADVGASQTLSFTLGSPSNATLGSTTVNTLTITEPQPAVQFSASSETVNQSAGTFSITVSLSAASDQAVSAPFTLGGGAVGGTDYSGVTASPLVIGAGQTSGTITGTLLADAGASQTLSFTLGSPSNATLGSTTVNTLTIAEPQPAVQFSTSSETVNQSAGTFSITVTLSTAADQAVSVPFTLGGSAVGGTDYSGVTASPLVIGAGQTSGTITGTLLADVGASQTLSFTLGSPSNATLGSTTVNTLTITEPTPSVLFSASSETVNQSAGTFSITVSLSAASDQAVSAPFTLGGSAIGGTDYSGVTASPLVIAAGHTAGTITGSLLPDVGASQTLSFTLGSPSNATLGSTTVNTLTITEPQPSVQFSASSETVNQSAGMFSITVSLSTASDQAVSAPFTLGGSAVGGTDYSGVTASPLVIAAGQTTGAITGTLLADVGASQTLSFTLGSPSNATLGSTTVNTLTITEPQPSVQFSASSETVNQSAGMFSITVSLSTASDQAVSAPFTLGGSAVGGTDYSGVTASPLVIAAGHTTGAITGSLLADVGASQTLSFTLGSPSNATLGSTTVNTLTIIEPQPSVQFSAASETVNQSAGTFSITVSLSAASDQAVSAPFTLGGGAVGGTDYSGVTASPLVIAAGHTTGTITGTLIPDIGASQTLSFTLGSPGNATLGSTTVNTLTITEPQPTVQFSTASETVNQSAGTFSITVSLSAASDQAVSAPFTLGGSAVGGTDYSGVTASPLVIGVGQTSGTITGTLLADVGASQTLSFTLGSPSNATLGSTTVNTLTITEPQPAVQFSASSETVNQSAGTFSITVSLSAASDQAVSAPFTLGGSAVGGTDYSGVTASPLVIAAGQTTGTITGMLLADVGASQTLSFTLGSPSNATLGSTTVNTLTITEPTPSMQFSASSETVNQSAGTFSITVSLSAASDQAVSTPFTLGGSAGGGTDYSGVTASPLVISAGQTSGTITGTLLADVGASQTLNFTLGSPSNATLGSTTVNTLTITEPQPSVQFSASSETVNQSAGTFSITVTLSAASDQAVSAPFTLGGSAVNGADYSGVTASPLVIAAGQTTGTITGTLLADVGASQTLSFTLGSPSNATLGSTTVNTLTITEPTPSVLFSASSETVNQSAGTFSITVTLSAASDQAVSAPFTLGGGAIGGTDYSGVTASPLVISAGHTAGTITGSLLPDVGASQTLSFTLGSPSNATLGSTTVNTLTITEPQPTVQFSASSETVSQSAGTFSVTVTLSAASDQAVSVPFTLGGSAVGGTDYSGVTASPLAIAAGQTSGTITGTLLAGVGASQTLTMTLGSPSNATLGSTTVNTLTITEPQPTVQFSASNETVNQSAGTFSITVTLSAASDQAVSVPFTLGGSAVGGTDYSGVTASPLVIGAGQTSGTITGTLLADVGASQTLSFTLGSPSNAMLGSTTVNTLTITEPQPSVQFSAASETVNQSAGTFSITVTLSAASDQAVSAPFTLGGSAVGGADYSGVTASPLVIAAGHTTGTITGTLIPDIGASQTLSFTLGSPGNATLGSTTVNTLTITEPQPTVQFSTASETVNQSAGTFSITVSLSAASDQAVSVPFTLGGSAVNGADYSGVTASPLVIGAGQTSGTITGTLLADVGASQTLTLTLGTPSNATLGSTTVNTLTITEPTPSVLFSASSETVNQSAGTFSITVTLSAASDQAVSAPFTLGGGAIGGTDYSGVTASPLVISAGHTAGTITGSLLPDVGASQTLSFTLGSPSNATLGSTTVNTLTITEPQPTVQFSASSETVSQSAGTFSITVSLSAASDQAVSAPFTLGGSAVGGADYSGVTASPLVIAAGHTTGTITGTLIPDIGASQTLSFTLGSPGNATLGSTTVNTLTITEPQPTVQFSTASETVNQSAGTFSITVSLSAASDQAVSAPFTLGGSAVGGTDYSGVTASPLVIGVGQTSGTITGTLLADVGASQTLSFTLGSPSNATLGSTTVNTLTITEPQPAVQFSASSETVNQSAGTFSITVTLSAASDQAVSAPFTLGGSAVGGADYSGVTASPLVIAAGHTTGTITGTLIPDIGASQTLSFTLGSPGNATLGSTTVNTLTITEPQPTVQFSTASETVNQSAGMFSITVSLSTASDQAVSAPFTLGGSAVGGTDYSGVTASPLVIAAGHTTGAITGSLLADVGASQTLSFTLGSPSNATLGSTTVNTLTIIEPQPSVQFSAASETVNQSAGTFSITVSLSAASDQAVSAPFTLGGSAVGGADYSGVTASPLVIAAGHTTGTITGTLIPDIGASQTLSFTLGSPGNATLGSTTVNTLTITEPQPTVQFSTASETVNQSAGTFSITVSLSAASDQAVSVPFTLGGSAVNGADYSGVTASPLVIGAGQTSGTITGTLLADVGASQTLTLTLGTPSNATLGSTTVNTLTITEPTPSVLFSASSETVNQSAGTFSITVTLSAASDQAVSAPFTLGGGAIGGTDYSGVTASPLVISAGHTAGTITGSLLPDVGASQTLSFTLGSPSNATLGSTTVNTLTITEPQPTVQFSASSETVSQSAGTFSITVSLSAASDQAVSAPFTLGGSAVGGADYSGVTASPLVIAAGHTTGTITGTLIPDIGASQTLSFTLGSPGNATLGSTTVNTLTITEPQPTVQFSTASETVNQSAGTFSITVSLSAASDQAVSAPFTLGGSAVGGTDYSGVTASPLVIGVGQTSGTITGTLLADVGASQTLSFTLGSPSNATLGSTTVNTLTITEPQPAVQFSASSETVNQSAGTFSITVTLSAASDQAVSAPFTLGGSAVGGADYSGVTASPLVIAAGHTTGTITGTLIPDIGASQTLSFTLGSPGNATLGSTTVNTLTITEPQPTVQFSTASETVNQSAGTFSITVSLSAASDQAVSVPFTLGGSAVNGADYSGVTASPLVIGAGQTSGTITGTLLADVGASQTLSFTLGSPSNATLGSTTVNTLTITEPQPAVQFSASSETVNQSAGTFSITVTLSAASDQAVSAPFTLGGSAVGGTDYSGVTASPLVIAPGHTTGTITGTLLADVGASQTLSFTLGSPGNATLGSTTVNTLTITEPQPTVQFSTASETVNQSAGTFSITVSLSAASDQAVSAPFTLGGSAVGGADYSGVTASPLVIAAGQTTGTITGTLLADVGASQTLSFTLGSPSNAALGSTTVNTLTITEPQPTVQFSASSETVNQSAGTFSITLTLSAASDQAVSAPFTLGGSAISGIDYSGVTASPLVIAAGHTPGTITGTLLADVGASQTLTITLGSPSNATLGSTTVNTLTITEPQPSVQFSASSETVNQSAGTFSITVSLSAASDQAVSAPFTLGGSAVGGTDYSGVTASPLVIAVGQTTGTITGTLLADVGASQTLSFTLGSPSNATLGSTTVNTLTITEPQPAVQFSASSETVNQSAGTFSITVSLSAASDQAVSAPFTLGGSAISGIDYSGVTASPLVIAAGHTTGTITGTLLADVGASQTLSFTLGSPSNATLGSTTVNTLTITEPTPSVQFSASSETVNQSAGTFSITVTLSAASDQAVSAPFTLGGSAVGGTDYSGVTASPLVIATGHTTGTITGSLLADVGASQTLTITLGSPSNATLGATTVNSLTINEPSITNVSPGGATLGVGSSTTITWTNASFTGNVDVLLSTNGGAGFGTTIISNLSNTGSCHWTVPLGVVSGTAEIRVQAHNGGAPQGTSGAFTISAATSSLGSVSAGSLSFSTKPQTLSLSAQVSDSFNSIVNEGVVVFTITDSHGHIVGTAKGYVLNGVARTTFLVPPSLPVGKYSLSASYSDVVLGTPVKPSFQISSGSTTFTIS